MKNSGVIGLNVKPLFDGELCPASAGFQMQSASPDFTLPTNTIIYGMEARNAPLNSATRPACALRPSILYIGKNNDYDLPCHSEDGDPPALPSFHHPETMAMSQIGNILEVCVTRGHSDISNSIFTSFNRTKSSVNNPDKRRRLVEYMLSRVTLTHSGGMGIYSQIHYRYSKIV
jgi:hypothetical protein